LTRLAAVTSQASTSALHILLATENGTGLGAKLAVADLKLWSPFQASNLFTSMGTYLSLQYFLSKVILVNSWRLSKSATRLYKSVFIERH